MPPKKNIEIAPITLETYDPTNAKSIISSPLSLQACKLEGVLVKELAYKPPEAFQERGLSPRLVKLRWDFYEAKRKDLLAAAKRCREGLIADEKREKGEEQNQLEIISRETGLSKGAVLALKGDTLKQERVKLLKAQENERAWLQNALNNELKQLQRLEGNTKMQAEEANKDMERQKEAARKLKELNDRRAMEEERKALEAEARQKLEKQIAREEFAKQQEELKAKAEIEAQEQKLAYERSVANAERKRQAEMEKAEKREAAYRDQEARKNELRAQDLRRQEVMEQQKESRAVALREQQDARDQRIFASIRNNVEIEQKRREDFEEKQKHDSLREERLAQERALEQEKMAKKSFQLMMKRKCIQEEAVRKMEEKRGIILEAQEDTEMRLLEHEQKKERYLDFKKELDSLRLKNKEINVERQRRKEEALREKIAADVKRKDEKIDCMRSERAHLWQLRRAAQTEAYRARELVKNEIIRQRVASKFDSKKLNNKLSALMQQEIFHPKVLQSASSMPLLRPNQLDQSQSPLDMGATSGSLVMD
eukprot:TRINITY_DN9385_c0_g1_i8.p1 TRINITY_DN9385_c0_g1~~TRINITY_DN9385_c0_g1_i8.p1  ORF type:complete len:540 (+),score=168.32 TRINITY_DN9385_c0_g1_i8:66-1685(+)